MLKPQKNFYLSKIFIFVVVLCLIDGFFIEPYWLEVNEFEIQTKELRRTSLKVVQISDLHCDKRMRNEEKLVTIINEMEPDIIVFTGDAINTPEALPLLKKTLSSLKARIGKFAVTGNQDVWFWGEFDRFGQTGFQVLDKNFVALTKDNESFYVSGMSYSRTGEAVDLLKHIPEGFNIFLYHTPDLIEDIYGRNVDLYLAGHTHGGQVCVPFFGAIVTLSKFGKKYESGLYHVGQTTLYVNRGVGMEGHQAPRIRFFCRPEISVFNITPAY